MADHDPFFRRTYQSAGNVCRVRHCKVDSGFPGSFHICLGWQSGSIPGCVHIDFLVDPICRCKLGIGLCSFDGTDHGPFVKWFRDTPVIMGLLFTVAGDSFFFPYQQPFVLGMLFKKDGLCP